MFLITLVKFNTKEAAGVPGMIQLRAANNFFLLKGHSLCSTKTPSWSDKTNCGRTSPKQVRFTQGRFLFTLTVK